MERLKKIAAFVAAFGREHPWIAVKFFLMFAFIAVFVSYNFGMTLGFSLAIGVTALSVANWKIFDAASNAFLDADEDDSTADLAKKTVVTAIKRFFYSALDYGEAALSIWTVVAMKKVEFLYLKSLVISWSGISLPVMIMGLDTRFILAMAVIWLVLDFLPAIISVAIYETKGEDITLGRSYRRMANVIIAHSRIAGLTVFTYEIVIASFWSGPDYTVLFFRDELKTWKRMFVATVAITTFHAILWTTVYWFGYENLVELATFILTFIKG